MEVNKDRRKVMEVSGELVALELLWDFMVYTFFKVGLECTDGMEGGPRGPRRGGEKAREW